MAAAKAAVALVMPPESAPKSRMSNTPAGMCGLAGCGMANGVCTGSIGSVGMYRVELGGVGAFGGPPIGLGGAERAQAAAKRISSDAARKENMGLTPIWLERPAATCSASLQLAVKIEPTECATLPPRAANELCDARRSLCLFELVLGAAARRLGRLAERYGFDFS
jgi:hypothetical protein